MYKLLVILNVFVAAGAQMLLKKGASREWGTFIRQYLNGWVVGGYSLMILTMVVNIYAIGKGVMVKDISIIESLSYLFVPCLSWIFFREKLGWMKIVAIAVIMTGVIVFFM